MCERLQYLPTIAQFSLHVYGAASAVVTDVIQSNMYNICILRKHRQLLWVLRDVDLMDGMVPCC